MMDFERIRPDWSRGNRGNSVWIILLLLLLVVSLVFNVYQYHAYQERTVRYEIGMDSVITHRVNVEKELDLTSSELDKYKGLSEKLDSVVNEGNARIAEQEEKIRLLLRESGNSLAENKKLRAELKELKRLKEEYLDRIDKLLTENEELREKTRKLDSTVASLNVQRGRLEKKVTLASVPKAEYLMITAFKKRNNGRYSETSLARKTNRIDVCFQLLGNRASGPGEKTVYIRMISPGEKVLGNRSFGSSSFMEAETNEELLYTARKEIEYTNAGQEVCAHYEEGEDKTFVPGQYVVEVYVDGYLSATSSFTLR